MQKRTSWVTVGLLIMLQLVMASPNTPAATAVVFANGNQLAPGSINATRVNAMRASGFNTVILFTMTIDANGNFTYNDGVPVCSNGVYTGGAYWASMLAQCRVAPTSVSRIEMCIAGWGDPSFANIKSRILADGTGTNTMLYLNLLALRNGLGVDAVCYDDESTYDATSSIQFGNMCGAVGLKVSLCPYTRSSYWSAVKSGLGSTCDAVYLQCYEGGAGNNPATWNNYFGGLKVIPGYWDWERDTTFLTRMQTWSAAGGPGGFLWPSCTGCNPPAGASELTQYAAWILDTFRTFDLGVTPSVGFSGIAANNSQAIPASTVFTLSNSTPSTLSWSVINTSSWLSVSLPAGVLAPGDTTTTTLSLNVAVATNLAPNVYAAGVVFSNRTSAVSVSRNFTLNTAVANWPLTVTGENAALIAPSSATPANPGATAFDIPNNYCLYQAGLSGSTRGLPVNGTFASVSDLATAFQLGPYGGTNALLLGYNYPKSGTLSLASPQAFNSLAILAASANGGGLGTFVINFADGSKSPVFNFNAQDWFYTVTNVAIQGFGRLRLGASFTIEDNGDSNPNLYQSTINLAALGLTQPVTSITFWNRANAGATETTAIFAISGMPSNVPLAPPANLTATPGTNATVRLAWSASAGATNYAIKRSTVSGVSPVTIGGTSNANYTDTGLVNGTVYYYVVAAEGTSSVSPDSSEVSAMPGSYRGWALEPTPVAYWPLDETSGTTAYDLAGGNNGTYSGAYVLGIPGVVGAGFASPHRAVHYNGSTGYTLLPRIIGSTNFSIVFWVQTAVTGGTPNWYNGIGLVDGEVGGVTDDFGVALVGGKIGFGVGNPDITLTSLHLINNYLWHQVAVTRDSGSGAMKIYLDGTLDVSTTGPTGPRTAPTNLRVGSLQTGIHYLNGNISDVTFYDQVLGANQIATLYRAATGLFYDVTLSNSWNGTNLVLTWPGNGKLLEATNLSGPWTTNLSPSPVTISPLVPQQFYRIQTH